MFLYMKKDLLLMLLLLHHELVVHLPNTQEVSTNLFCTAPFLDYAIKLKIEQYIILKVKRSFLMNIKI